jgi:hypothetical protein
MAPAEPYTQQQIDDALTALIAYAGNATGAVKYLEAAGKRAPAVPTLIEWSRTRHWERYEELREKVAQKLEGTLANNYLDAARYATETMVLAVDKARERLENNKDDDPARSAASLAKVATSATDKRLALQGRPSQIVETRNIGEIMRSLAAKGVIALPEEPPQLEEGDGDGVAA